MDADRQYDAEREHFKSMDHYTRSFDSALHFNSNNLNESNAPGNGGTNAPMIDNIDEAFMGLWDMPRKSNHSRIPSEVPRTPSPGPMCYEFSAGDTRKQSASIGLDEPWGPYFMPYSPISLPTTTPFASLNLSPSGGDDKSSACSPLNNMTSPSLAPQQQQQQQHSNPSASLNGNPSASSTENYGGSSRYEGSYSSATPFSNFPPWGQPGSYFVGGETTDFLLEGRHNQQEEASDSLPCPPAPQAPDPEQTADGDEDTHAPPISRRSQALSRSSNSHRPRPPQAEAQYNNNSTGWKQQSSPSEQQQSSWRKNNSNTNNSNNNNMTSYDQGAGPRRELSKGKENKGKGGRGGGAAGAGGGGGGEYGNNKGKGSKAYNQDQRQMNFGPQQYPNVSHSSQNQAYGNDNWGTGGKGSGKARRGKNNALVFAVEEPQNGSNLMEEFRRKGTVDIRDLCDAGPSRMIQFAEDQFGSRFLQHRIENASLDEKNIIFENLRECTVELSQDVFGNYVIQKFFDFGTHKQIQKLTSSLLGSVLDLTLQMYGCRVVQKALEWCSIDLQLSIVRELRGNIIMCVENQNGNHVIQKSIERMPANQISFIVHEIASSDLVALSQHCYGCRVLQRVIENCREVDVAPIYDKVVYHWRTLASDPYGNYVVQHIMEHGRINDKRKLIHEMTPIIQKLACDKFGSNVLERSFMSLPKKERGILINAMLGNLGETVIELSRDRYGNYIIQRLLETCVGQEKDTIISILSSRANELKGITYGKHIVTALERTRTNRPSRTSA